MKTLRRNFSATLLSSVKQEKICESNKEICFGNCDFILTLSNKYCALLHRLGKLADILSSISTFTANSHTSVPTRHFQDEHHVSI